MKLLLLIFVFLNFSISACYNKPGKAKVKKITIVELYEPRAFIDFWKGFSIKFNSLDTALVRSIALDSIWLWGDFVTSNEFITRYYSGYSDSDFLGILDTNKIRYGSIGCYTNPTIKDAIQREDSKAFNCMEAAIIQDTVGSIINGIEFSFLETSKGYRLFGIEHASYYWRMDNSLVDTTAIEK